MTLPTIKKTHKLILLAAALFAVSSTIIILAFHPTHPPASKKGLSYSVFKTSQGWGYDVLLNQQIIIHQPFIPGESGYQGFATEQQAVTTAQFVIEKIKSKEIPALNHEQLQRLGVLRSQPR